MTMSFGSVAGLLGWDATEAVGEGAAAVNGDLYAIRHAAVEQVW